MGVGFVHFILSLYEMQGETAAYRLGSHRPEAKAWMLSTNPPSARVVASGSFRKLFSTKKHSLQLEQHVQALVLFEGAANFHEQSPARWLKTGMGWQRR